MRSRLFMSMIVAALAATAIQLVAAAPAQAAPVSCTGTAKVFDGRADGSIWYYEHRAPATGDASWTAGRRIGAGFAGPTVASTGGTIYYVNPAGELRRYRYDGTQWTDGAGTVVGTGWQSWVTGGRYQLTADSQGRLFALDGFGTLLMFDQSVARWDPANGIPLDTGWSDDQRVVAAGDNVFYRVNPDTGGILRYRYDSDSQRLTNYPREFGTGWRAFDKLFSPGGDVLYGVLNGTLYWYRFDADTGTWANGGNGKVVGSGWSDRRAVTATTGTCTVPAPAPVGTATPAGTDPEHSPEITGVAQHLKYTYLDEQGRAIEAKEDGDVLRRRQLGDLTFGADLSAATPRAGQTTNALLGVDRQGGVWLAEGNGEIPAWRPFGKGMTKAVLTEAFIYTGDPLGAIATDPSGALWLRHQHSVYGFRWMAWQRVDGSGFDTAADANGLSYGVSGTNWFLFSHYYDGSPITEVRVRHGQVPAAADFGPPSAAEGSRLPATLIARHRTSGQPYTLRQNGTGTGFETAWRPMPQLVPDDPAVTLGELPASATQLGNLKLAVAAVGSDGHVYVTRGSASTGEFQPWQRVGEPAVSAPQLVMSSDIGVSLFYRGQDGRFYHYFAFTPDNSNPLVFDGQGRSLA